MVGLTRQRSYPVVEDRVAWSLQCGMESVKLRQSGETLSNSPLLKGSAVSALLGTLRVCQGPDVAVIDSARSSGSESGCSVAGVCLYLCLDALLSQSLKVDVRSDKSGFA